MGDRAGAEAEGESRKRCQEAENRTAQEGREGVRAASPKMRKQPRPGCSSHPTLPNEGHTGGLRADPGGLVRLQCE